MSPYAEHVAETVRRCWADAEIDAEPGHRLIWALVAYPSRASLADIPRLPECVSIEIDFMPDLGALSATIVGVRFARIAAGVGAAR